MLPRPWYNRASTMSDARGARTTMPIKLPQVNRDEPPPRPETIRGMAANTTKSAKRTALYVDKDWGLWLDPDAGTFHYDAQMTHDSAHIIIKKLPDGYHVQLGGFQKWK